jgi:hypothetical protein
MPYDTTIERCMNIQFLPAAAFIGGEALSKDGNETLIKE